MRNWPVESWLLIIGAITTMITSIIAAIKSNAASTGVKDNTNKLNTIQDQAQSIKENTDGNLDDLRSKYRYQLAVNDHMIEIISCLVDMLPEGSLTKAKKEVERLKSEIGYRRETDFKSDFSAENLGVGNASEIR